MMFVSILILVLLAIIAVNTISAQNVTCNAERRQAFDLDIQRVYLFGSIDRKYPTNTGEINKFCDDSVAINNQIKEYREKCLDKFAKQIVNLMTYAITKITNNICKSRRRSAEFTRIGRCGNAAKVETAKCWDNMTLGFAGVEILKGIDKLKFPLIYCNFYEFQNCNLHAYESFTSVCKQSSIDGLDLLLDRFAIEPLRPICGDYTRDSDKCDKIIGLTPKVNLKVIPKSPIDSFVNVLNSVPV